MQSRVYKMEVEVAQVHKLHGVGGPTISATVAIPTIIH